LSAEVAATGGFRRAGSIRAFERWIDPGLRAVDPLFDRRSAVRPSIRSRASFPGMLDKSAEVERSHTANSTHAFEPERCSPTRQNALKFACMPPVLA
jgi:hypothetical protein